jgi:hypothetical protein
MSSGRSGSSHTPANTIANAAAVPAAAMVYFLSRIARNGRGGIGVNTIGAESSSEESGRLGFEAFAKAAANMRAFADSSSA